MSGRTFVFNIEIRARRSIILCMGVFNPVLVSVNEGVSILSLTGPEGVAILCLLQALKDFHPVSPTGPEGVPILCLLQSLIEFPSYVS